MAKIATTLTSLPQHNSINQKFVRDEDERPTMGYNHFSNDIPVISLAGINGGERAEICRKIVAACEDWGIFQVVDHGVDSELVAEMTRLAREFFALPPEHKLRFDMSGGKKGGFIVSSHLQGEAVQDWREIVTYFTYPIGARDYRQWPDQPEVWRGITEAYSAQLMELGCQLLEVVSEAMGLEKDALCNACVEMDQKVVVNFYPKFPQPDLTLGLKRHTDPGPSGRVAGDPRWRQIMVLFDSKTHVSEQWEAEECRSSSSSELKLQQIVDRDVPESGSWGHSLPPKD